MDATRRPAGGNAAAEITESGTPLGAGLDGRDRPAGRGAAGGQRPRPLGRLAPSRAGLARRPPLLRVRLRRLRDGGPLQLALPRLRRRPGAQHVRRVLRRRRAAGQRPCAAPPPAHAARGMSLRHDRRGLRPALAGRGRAGEPRG
ncbi:hypothetical protein E2C04_11260 [Nocardioides daphniae]|uniref:Uncharacterized protein n=1 Tax=Nocardioides daphniae TaxID=402297 RepID=A0A4V1CWK7_9ACTN|nr:hypothetical protein E2C04_11260 [Nocardioides daphniae]